MARLKFKARKLGISEILAQSNRVRIGRIDPPESIQMRMGRIYKGTQYRPVTTSSSSPPRSPGYPTAKAP